MQRYFLFLVLMGLITSCSSDIQTNTPAFQGEVDNVFFKANNSTAVLNSDGSVTIFGETAVEFIEVSASSTAVGTYEFGTDSPNVAEFTTFTGNTYTTENDGNGKIEITGLEAGTITANLNFNARQPGVNDTLNFQRGIIFQVPIGNFTPEPGDGGGTGGNTDFAATVDGASFNSAMAQASENGGFIFITGVNSQGASISIIFPNSTEPGTYDITETGDYRAIYGVDGNGTSAESGTLTITANNMLDNTQGSFEFITTNGISVSNGSFNLDY